MLTCDRTSDPRIPLSKRSSTCAKSSVDIGAPHARRPQLRRTSPPPPPAAPARESRWRDRRAARRRGTRSRTARGPASATRCRRRRERTGPVDLEPPVPVRREGQPVLQVAAVHAPQPAELAIPDARPHLLHERVEPDVEVRAVDEAARSRQLEQLSRLIGGQRERLLARRASRPRGRASPARGGGGSVSSGGRRRPGRLREARRTTRRPERSPSQPRAGVDPATPVTSTPSRRSASTCTTPMKPVPTTAASTCRPGLHSVSARIVTDVVRSSPGSSIGRRPTTRSCARPRTEQLAGSTPRAHIPGAG